MQNRLADDPLNMLSPIPKTDLCEEVTTRLAELVTASKPGTRLPAERELAERLQVGRSTVREAVRTLHFMGAVDVIQGHGIIVSSPENADAARLLGLGVIFQRPTVQEVIYARNVLEVEVAGLAALNRDVIDIETLKEIMQQIRFGIRDHTMVVPMDLAFHIALFKASKNTVMVYFVNGMRPLYKVWMQNAISGPPVVEEILVEHQGILNAVIDGNADAARDAMRSHLTFSTKRLVTVIDGESNLNAYVTDVMKMR